MRREEVLEILDYKILLEEEKEYPNEEVIAVLSEAIHLITLIDDIEICEEDYTEEETDEDIDNITCFCCGEHLKECICDCPKCDDCDECTCCDSEEDFELTDEELKELVDDVFTGLLEILYNK